MTPKVNLPRVLDLITLERPDSARAEAERRARAGADEGTMVWALGQSEAVGRGGNTWMSGANNLHCALVLRPELSLAECCQLSLLATLACSIAIAEQAEPLAELRYRWPNDVLLNRGKVAGVSLSGELTGDTVTWMVLALNVNVFEHPSACGFDAASMRGEGFAQYDREILLSAYGRELVSWLGRWSDEGFAPLGKAWLVRGEGDQVDYNIDVAGRTVIGKFAELQDSGDVSIRTNETDTQTLTLEEFFRPDFQAREA